MENIEKNSTVKNILGRIWALWGLVTFISTFLIIFLPSMGAYLFKNEWKGQYYFLRVSEIWMRVWLTLIGCPIRVHNKEAFAPGENYIVTTNHNALLDVPLSCPFVPGANKTIAKSSFAKVPLFGLFYTRGSVLVDRKSERSRIKSVEDMKEVLAKGMHMCIYPEGTRNRTNEPLKSFYDGAFKLSMDTGKSIIPAVITGTRKAMPPNKSFYLWPTRLEMFFKPPVSPAGKSVTDLKNEVFTIMQDEYIKQMHKRQGLSS